MSEVRRRGKGKKGALHHVTLRIPAYVWAYYEQSPSPSVKMRQVLEEYVKKELDKVNACDNVPPQ